MGRKALEYVAGLIALYIVTANATNFGKVISAGSHGSVSNIKALQGR